jgi:small subunit ribosomal protein S16
VIEELGTYDPYIPEPDARVVLDGERVAYWLGVGAQASPKVSVLIRKYGKDGSHIDAQQQALNRLAARKSNAITAAQESARLAAIAENKRREEAEAKRKADEAAAAAAQAAETAPSAANAETESAAQDVSAEQSPSTESTPD